MSNTEQPESTVNEYLTKVRDDSGPGVVRPLFEENIKFEFWGQCIDELKDNVFFRNNDETASNTSQISHLLSTSSNLLEYQETRKKADFMGPIPRMTPAAGIKAIDKLSKHSLSWYKEEEYKENDFDKVFKHINDFEHNISVLNEEVRMVQHMYKTPNVVRDSLLEETVSSFIKEAHWMQKKSENFVWRIKRNYDRTFKNQASAIKTIEKNLGRIAESIHRREVGTLPSFTETNPRGLAHAITTRGGLNYQPPKKPLEDSNGLQNITTKHIPTTEIITPEQTHNITKKTDPPIPFPIVLNKVPPKEKDPVGFTIPFVIRQSGITKALADLGASISLIPYLMFLRLNLDRQICFPSRLLILDMEEDHRIPIILGRPFLATAHAMIDVFNKNISFEVGDEIITFDLEKSMRFPMSDEDICHSADIIDLSIVDNIKEILPQNHDNSIEPILDHLPAIHEDCDNPALFAAKSIDEEKPTPKLKELPSHLEYAFLDNNHELPVIISSLLSDQEKSLLLELICDASDYAVGAVLGQRIEKKFRPIYYASKTMNNAQEHYTTTEKELLAVDAKPRLIRWVLLLLEFTIEIKDKKGNENLAADHLSKLENLGLEELNKDTIQDNFPNEHLMVIKLKDTETDPWADITAQKIFEYGFYWPTIFKDAAKYIQGCDACQRAGNISSPNQMPLTNILVSENLEARRQLSRPARLIIM
ncbi:reverse transcriptase domain-containing protein, partial [Tanacetum coccineum]